MPHSAPVMALRSVVTLVGVAASDHGHLDGSRPVDFERETL